MNDDRLTVVDQVSLAISRIAMVLVAVIVAIIAFEVFMRYLLERPTLWVNELSLWLGGLIYLFAGLYTMQKRAHIRITALYDVVPRGVQRVFDTVSTVIVVLFATGLCIGGFKSAWRALSTWERYGTAWDPPIPATVKPLILVVCAMIAIQAVNNLIVDFKKSKAVRPPTPNAE